ncbi:MAG: DUF2024 family protein [Anaerolineales bacterium]|nr:DUF2024 family protein [Anaerolineales bacterium]MCB8940477.1 DUF2024 family protein [Ardenticatenaceae bacterium]MCP5303785.1 DUF2024 family protein [Pseudomonadales bacterium]
MNCDVFDTYVTKPGGEQMHFDIIVPSGTQQKTVLTYGQAYLAQVGVSDGEVTTEQCRFCHVEQATPEMQQAIEQKGYFILAMEGCPPVAAN